MATSNSYDYTQDRDTIIRSAFEIVGVAVQGENLETEEITVANRVLNAMLKAWIVHGLQVWKRKTYTITPLIADKQFYDLGTHGTYNITLTGTGTVATATLVNHGYITGQLITVTSVTTDANYEVAGVAITVTGVSTFTYASTGTGSDSGTGGITDIVRLRPERILEADRVDSSGDRVSLTELSRNEYDNLPNLTDSGTPIQYHYERQLGTGRFYIWPTADSSAVSDYTIELVYQSQIEDMDATDDDLDMPQEWIEPVTYGLAYRLAQRYGMKGSERDRLRLDSEYMIKLAKDYDVESGSCYFQPELERR